MTAADYPTIIPIYPLPAPLLLPATVVPIVADEDRYRLLVDDVLAGDGLPRNPSAAGGR